MSRIDLSSDDYDGRSLQIFHMLVLIRKLQMYIYLNWIRQKPT
jgi:hypothetical protein